MNRIINISLLWFYTIGKKIFTIKPINLLVIVLLTIVSEFSILLASVLPLKVLILLGSSSIPKYFPEILQILNKEQLVFGLSGLAIFFFILHVLSNKYIEYASTKGSTCLIKQNNKVILYENQNRIAENAYLKYSRSLAAISYLFIVAGLLQYIYPNLIYPIIIYIIVVWFLFTVSYQFFGAFKQSLNEQLAIIIHLVATIGSLTIFFYIVIDFLYTDSHPSLIFGIVGLILVRQIMGKIERLIKDIQGLYLKRLQINALFFDSHVKKMGIIKHEIDFWFILQEGQRHIWIKKVLNELVKSPLGHLSSVWKQTGYSNIIAFEISIFNNDKSVKCKYLIKIFNKNLSAKAIHEATLLEKTSMQNLPTLNFIGTSFIENYHCHLFYCENVKKPTLKNFQKMKMNLFTTLITVVPCQDILQRYIRSHPLLGDRLQKKMLSRLYITVDSQYVEDLQEFENKFESIIAHIKRMPLQIINPNINQDTTFINKYNNLVVMHWGDWKIEPIGWGYPIIDLENIPNIIKIIKTKRSDIKVLSVGSFALIALVCQFEIFYNRQRFFQAIELIPNILKYYKKILDD